MISVSMHLDENEYQLLNFVELNGPELFDIVGKPYGKPQLVSNWNV
jgi:hypothetical protein